MWGNKVCSICSLGITVDYTSAVYDLFFKDDRQILFSDAKNGIRDFIITLVLC